MLTTQETLNWIAFGSPLDDDLLGREAANIAGRWRYPPNAEGETSEMLVALQEQAGMDSPKLLEARARPAPPKWLVNARIHAVELQELYRMPAASMVAALETDLTQYRRNLHRFWNARQELLEALADGRLRAIANRAAKPDLATGRCLPGPMGSAMEVPTLFFSTMGVWLEAWGRITVPGEDPGYLNTKFRTKEVAAIWLEQTAPDLDKNTPPQVSQPVADQDPAFAWMQKNVTRDQPWKLESALKACMTDAKVTYRAAQAAWKSLPKELRGTRGAHK